MNETELHDWSLTLFQLMKQCSDTCHIYQHNNQDPVSNSDN